MYIGFYSYYVQGFVRKELLVLLLSFILWPKLSQTPRLYVSEVWIVFLFPIPVLNAVVHVYWYRIGTRVMLSDLLGEGLTWCLIAESTSRGQF